MANSSDCLQYCSVPIDDYDGISSKINDVKCRCLNCMGARQSVCDVCNLSAKLQIELKFLQKIRCNKCKYYNGK